MILIASRASGANVYGRIHRLSDGFYFNGSTFETFTVGNWSTYAITMTEESTSGTYKATQTLADGYYALDAFVRAGVSPAVSDGPPFYSSHPFAVVSNAPSGLTVDYAAAKTAATQSSLDSLQLDMTATYTQAFDARSAAADASIYALSANTYAATILTTINSARISTRSMLLSNGQHMVIVRGRDYNVTVNDYPQWVDTGGVWPTLTGGSATLSFRLKDSHGNVSDTAAPELSTGGTITVGSGSNKTIRAYLTAAQTVTLQKGDRNYVFTLDATLSGGSITQLVRGETTILAEGI